MKHLHFSYRKESKLNPGIGFTSFQHFRGGKLYSDVVVDKARGMCETEDYECYPVTKGVKEEGRSEGYYPDSTIAYIRVLWKEFEPVRGQYNYKIIEDILEECREHKQTLMFRLMAHSTCERDDVPDWLRSIVDCPARPAGKRVKDSPYDETFLVLFGEAIAAIGKRFDEEPLFEIMDICLPGSWGEGYNIERYSLECLKRLMDVYTENFKHTCLIGQVISPELVRYVHETHPVGWRGDGTGFPRIMSDIMPGNAIAMGNVWETAPVSFESYWWLKEWQRQGWDIHEMVEKTLSWHLSHFNAKSFPCPEDWKGAIDDWVARMGYHYVLKDASYEERVPVGDGFRLLLQIENRGVAPIYQDYPLVVRFRGEGAPIDVSTEIDIRTWMPGERAVSIELPASACPKSGEFEVEFGILDRFGDPLAFACDAKTDEGFLKLGKVFFGN